MDIRLTNSNDRFDTETKDDFVSLKKKRKINIYSDRFKKTTVAVILILSLVVLSCITYLYNNIDYYYYTNIEETFAQYCYYAVDTNLNLQSEENIINFYQKYYNDYPYSRIDSRINDFNYMSQSLKETKNFVYVIKDKYDNIVYSNLKNNPNISISYKTGKDGQLVPVYSINSKYEMIEAVEVTATTARAEGYQTEASASPALSFNEYLNPAEILMQQSISISFINGEPDNYLLGYYDHNYISNLLEKIDAKDYKIYCAIIQPMYEDTGDIFYSLQYKHNNMQNMYSFLQLLICIFSAIILAGALSLVYTAGQSGRGSDIKLTYTDNMGIGLQSAILVGIAFFEFIILSIFEIYTQKLAYILLPINILIVLSYLCSFSRQYKAKILFKNGSVRKLYSKIKYFCMDYSFPMILLSIVFLIILNGIWYMVMFFNEIYYGSFFIVLIFGFTVILDLIFLIWLFRFVISFQKIKKLTREISVGNVDTEIDCKKMSISTRALAQDINHLQDGLNKAIDKAVKGERLKTELITNVSHDLKTPLTSIINYVDLLKKESIQNPKANEYIQVLDDKSSRLKQLIDDLVEASKASSGNISIELQRIDLCQLIQQACGEYEEKLSKNNLEIKLNCCESAVFVKGDSRHMWRIVENLLSNISKYAMPSSRVYIDITKDDFNGILTIKNISYEALDISPEQLTERFVRGDGSRTTEGSGLGLSIAQSLTQAQKGDFKIDIDGDLFKVTVQIPLYEN